VPAWHECTFCGFVAWAVCMRLPLAVVTRLAVHNFLMEHGMKVSVPSGTEEGRTPAVPADVPTLLTRILDAHQRRVEQFAQFRRRVAVSRALFRRANCSHALTRASSPVPSTRCSRPTTCPLIPRAVRRWRLL